MNKAANTYWTDARLAAQRPAARSFTIPSPVAVQTVGEVEMTAPRATVRRRAFAIPSWVVFCMIMLATFAVCVTVTMRTHAEMSTAESKLGQMSTDVKKIRSTNDSLRQEVERLRKDPRAIEAAARTRLNMVRANEIVVPIQ
ncbi:MAG TPA: septum formation initiator family protein [Pyrinomonadaceae bacterium]|nr:septum formation initiator family protein [Pyrinomonadaceae bacterium]